MVRTENVYPKQICLDEYLLCMFTGKAFEYEPEFQGPKKYRKSTDVACIYLFLVFMLIWISGGIFG